MKAKVPAEADRTTLKPLSSYWTTNQALSQKEVSKVDAVIIDKQPLSDQFKLPAGEPAMS